MEFLSLKVLIAAPLLVLVVLVLWRIFRPIDLKRDRQ
jgi:hypothetical protein